MEKVSSYAMKDNVSRLSDATTATKASTYTSRVNVSRLGSVHAEAFVRNASLLSRLGGESALSSLVRIFYGKALPDPRINKLIDTPDAADLENQVQKQIAFLKAEMGGVNDGSVDVAAICAYLKTLRVSDVQFNAFMESVTATLRGQNVPHPMIDEVVVFFDELRKRVAG